MIQMYDYHADDLDEHEVDYELAIRGGHTDGSIEVKRRDLRSFLKEDRKNPRIYNSNVPLEDEIPYILQTITAISSELQRQVTNRLRSKLISLGNRINRAPTNDNKSKQVFLEKVRLLLDTYFTGGIAEGITASNQTTVPLNENLRRQTLPLNPTAQEFQLNPMLSFDPPMPQTTPNISFAPPHVTSSPGNQIPGIRRNDLVAAANAIDLNEQIENEMGRTRGATRKSPTLNNPPAQAEDANYQNQLSGLFTGELKDFIRSAISDALKNYINDWASLPTPNISSVLPNPTHNVATNTSHTNYSQTMHTEQVRNVNDRVTPRLPNVSVHTPPPPPNYHNNLRIKIEKWQIFFSGEVGPRSLSVAEFIRQVTILAKANRVSEDELLQQAYIFFTGEARKWYFTYWEKFTTWGHLVHYLTMSFENPNKDKAIEDEMRERKQRPNERFSAYLADMERLSQSLTQRMNERQKLKLIFENTKLSYRRRLALVQINSINDLADYCYQFDSLEPSLFLTTATRGHVQNVNQIDLDDFENLNLNDEEGEEINALYGSKAFRSKNLKRDTVRNSTVPQQVISNPTSEDTSILINCWNCRKSGHVARYCPEQKRIYCYACGEPNVTKSNCPNQHGQEANEKN